MKFPLKPDLADLAGRTIFGERIPQTKSKTPTPTGIERSEPLKSPLTTALLPKSAPTPWEHKNLDRLTNLPPDETEPHNPVGSKAILSGEDKRSEASTNDKSKAPRRPTNMFLEMTQAEMDNKSEFNDPGKAGRKVRQWMEGSPKLWGNR